jgi:1-deoxy-D-xylulose-5-phosphate synthase
LHLKTVKGQGYSPAAADPIAYHAPKNFMAPKKDAGADDKPKVEAPPITYSQLFGDTIVESARRDRRIVAVTAAMPGGTGLGAFAKEFPARYFDVGICEQHGGAFSSGLSYSGLRPVYAVYSTFCQRAYDQFVHDVCIQENSVIFCLDRAGLVEDGWTHHGVFDIAYMRCVPNVILMAPRDGAEFRRMFAFALEQSTAPVAIRYPRAELPLHLPAAKDAEIEPGKAEVLLEGEDVAVFAYGSMVEVSFQAALKLRQRGVEVTVVNGRFAKPLDVEILRQLSVHHHTLITAEEHALMGGFGSAVLEALGDQGIIYDRTVRLGIPDRFITYGNRKLLLRECGLDVDGVEAAIENALDAPRRAPERVRALPDAELLPRPSRSGR